MNVLFAHAVISHCLRTFGEDKR